MTGLGDVAYNQLQQDASRVYSADFSPPASQFGDFDDDACQLDDLQS